MKPTLGLAVALTLALAVNWLPGVDATRDERMRIFTYPTGLVVGDLEVKVDLGHAATEAHLSPDGAPECAITAADVH